jgi:hypothetical protein
MHSTSPKLLPQLLTLTHILIFKIITNGQKKKKAVSSELRHEFLKPPTSNGICPLLHSVFECLLEKSPKKKSAGVRTFEGRIYFVDFGSEKMIHQNLLIW